MTRTSLEIICLVYCSLCSSMKTQNLSKKESNKLESLFLFENVDHFMFFCDWGCSVRSYNAL